jgi:hypothetical protein
MGITKVQRSESVRSAQPCHGTLNSVPHTLVLSRSVDLPFFALSFNVHHAFFCYRLYYAVLLLLVFLATWPGINKWSDPAAGDTEFCGELAQSAGSSESPVEPTCDESEESFDPEEVDMI